MTSHIVQVFLPLGRRDGSPQPREAFASVRKELLDRCGGVTIYARAPAEGLWQDDEDVAADRIVIFEAVDDNFDPDWWSRYKATLQSQFDQEEILISAIAAVRL
jgi:hypothetical protein